MKKRILLFLCLILVCWLKSGSQAAAQETGAEVNLDEEPKPVTVEVHYMRYDEDYDGWNLWLWADENEGQGYFFKPDQNGVVTEIVLEQVDIDTQIGILIRRGDWEEKDVETDRFLDVSQIKDGRLVIWLRQGEEAVYYGEEQGPAQILDASLESETEVTFRVFGQLDETFQVVDREGKEYDWKIREMAREGELAVGKLTLKEKVPFPDTLYFMVGESRKCIRFGGIYDTEMFMENFIYEGNDLGAACSGKESRFCIWSPVADQVTLLLYEEGNGGEPLKTAPLSKEEKGVWRLTLEGDYRNLYYTYLVHVQEEEWEVVDPYAKSCGVNGQRGMLLSDEEGMPEGFETDTFLEDVKREDVILYEMSVRDYTSNEASGVVNRGKFLGLTEEGTTNPKGDSTGLSYLAELGITHVHLLPIQDFGDVDEENSWEQYNWGYMPVSYFIPEGSYSTDPYHGEVRVRECRQMIQSLHEQRIGVIMDVVYNHTWQGADSNLNHIVPGYYHRIGTDGSYSNGSACGNEIASERAMVRKYLIDSVTWWMEAYHVDGFRFDLMGLIDLETMQAIEKRVYEINPNAVLYGEGWDAGETIYEGERTESKNACLTPKIGTFNNVFRRAVQKYICGMVEEEEVVLGMKFGFAGAGDNPNTLKRMGKWTENPLQCINYASCHDGYTMWDLITLNCPDEDEEMLRRRDRFGAACVLLCQGTPFFQSGEEFLRTKTAENDPDRKYSNSYNQGDYVNNISWENRTENVDVLEYYKGLILFRKAHRGLRYVTQTELNDNLIFIDDLPENVTGYYAREPVNFFVDNQICILLNPTLETVEYTPVSGTWRIYVNAGKAGIECMEEIEAGKALYVEGASALGAVRTVVRIDRIVLVIFLILLITGICLIYKKSRERKKEKKGSTR